MSAELHEIVIQGFTHSGEVFRPRDWAERLCGMMSIFGVDKRINYAPYLQPVTVNGTRCVVVNTSLQAMDPPAYEFLIAFARDNGLVVRPGRTAKPEGAETKTESEVKDRRRYN